MLGWYLINDDMNICIAMEYMPHGDLHSYLKDKHPLSESDAQQVIRQVLQGLRIMHKARFAHRDVKPQNVLIQHHPGSKASRPWRVKLADFGFSKSVLASNSNVAVGTYGYMAPELFHKPADGTKLDERKADIWATGAMAFYLMSKDEGFQSWRSLDFLKKTCRGEKVSLYGGPEPVPLVSGPFRRFFSSLNPEPRQRPIRDQKKTSSALRPLLTAPGINFIREMTMFEPEHRLMADEALDHPWLSHLKRKQGRRGKKDR
jgi:serine/threonine protein kinase